MILALYIRDDRKSEVGVREGSRQKVEAKNLKITKQPGKEGDGGCVIGETRNSMLDKHRNSGLGNKQTSSKQPYLHSTN